MYIYENAGLGIYVRNLFDDPY